MCVWNIKRLKRFTTYHMTDSAAASVVRHRDEKSVCDILRRKMDGFLRALGFDKQPDYAEKIPDTLSADNIFVHDVS